jgi:hypothetical protein
MEENPEARQTTLGPALRPPNAKQEETMRSISESPARGLDPRASLMRGRDLFE